METGNWDYYFESGKKEQTGVYKNGKYGFVNRTGHCIIPFRFDKAYNFNESLARVELYGCHGFINKDGSWAIRPNTWDYIKGYSYYHVNPIHVYLFGTDFNMKTTTTKLAVFLPLLGFIVVTILSVLYYRRRIKIKEHPW